MNEKLLQFIWQFQYFNKGELTTVSGEPLRILFAGELNTNQGPDFHNARISIGNTTWAGSAELHIKTSDWYKHGHQHDKNYNNVVLHVVWEHDEAPRRPAKPEISPIPILELKGRVPGLLLQRYTEMMNAVSFIACEKSIAGVNELVWKSWKERLLAERLLRKTKQVQISLRQNKHHWEETAWWLLARNFGVRINADAFEAIARSIPFTVLIRTKPHLHQLEALLMGQAGLLEETFWEDYPLLLQREYRFLQHKYSLRKCGRPVHSLRMRPMNFPAVRLAQLAKLVNKSTHLFTDMKEAGTLETVKEKLAVTAGPYWQYHYRFGENSAYKKKKLGESMIGNIIINTVAPLLFAWGEEHDDELFRQKALDWLELTKAESNFITRGFQKAGVPVATAFDSQALIELKNEYCDHKRCLQCAVGHALFKKKEG